jgi:hypothetical protein
VRVKRDRKVGVAYVGAVAFCVVLSLWTLRLLHSNLAVLRIYIGCHDFFHIHLGRRRGNVSLSVTLGGGEFPPYFASFAYPPGLTSFFAPCAPAFIFGHFE